MSMMAQFERGKILSHYTTFGIGGPADYFLEIQTISSMQNVIRFCHQEKLPFHVMGKGSNSLFDDHGYSGLVILNKISLFQWLSSCTVYVGAGYHFSLLGVQTARAGLSGLEFASGIPASVGGAVFMNAGANGSETSSCLVSVDFVNEEGNLITIPKNSLEFSYRSSSFQNMQGAIVGATFQLTPSREARQKQLSIIEYRKKTQPLSEKSIGCIFRNPSCGHAGALIEQCGLKGYTRGEAKVSEIHANFIINKGKATAIEILSLIDYVKAVVKEKTSQELEPEIWFIPFKPKHLVSIHDRRSPSF